MLHFKGAENKWGVGRNTLIENLSVLENWYFNVENQMFCPVCWFLLGELCHVLLRLIDHMKKLLENRKPVRRHVGGSFDFVCTGS